MLFFFFPPFSFVFLFCNMSMGDGNRFIVCQRIVLIILVSLVCKGDGVNKDPGLQVWIDCEGM